MIRKTALLLILLFIIQIIPGFHASADESFRDLAAQSAILAETEGGTILYQHNAHVRHPADSLTKIMTLLLASHAIENDVIGDHELITMTESAWVDINENSTTLDIQPGEVMSFIDLMYCAYVGNANEANNMIALRLAGSINAFVIMMNEKAAELGATETRFINPHGQHHELQYTTAHDQFVIFKEAMKSLLFAEVAGTFRHITESIDDFDSRTITSSNFMLSQSSRYYYRNLIAGRDSATFEGGYSLITMAEEEGLSFISVVLGSYDIVFDDGSAELRNYTESIRLIQWGYSQFAVRDILKTTDLLARVPIQHGSGVDFVNARPESSLSLLLNNAIPTESFIRNITLYYNDDNPLIAPISSGDVLGEVRITHNGFEYARMNLVANTDVSLNGIEFIRRQISAMLSTALARNIIILLALILILYIVLVVRYNIARANRMRKIKNAKKDIMRQRQEDYRDY